MSHYSLVLSDDLLKVYFEFRQGKIENSKLVEHFFNFYHAPYLTNAKQLERINHDNPPLLQSLAAQGFISQSLDDLAKQTRYKIVLNTASSAYPYVNIFNDSVEKNFSLTFRVGEKRDKAIHLITALCSEAKFILIFDSYLCRNWNDTQQFFHQVLPKKKLTLLHDEGHLNTKASYIKRICPHWTIKEDRRGIFKKSHDRYLLIDNKIEIILSSGFQYLFATDKDLTCLIREL